MTHAAPEMAPSLDEALRAMGGRVPLGLGVVDQFLARLDNVRECPAVVLDQAQAAFMEGAYLAGVRCADESGHVLVMSLPDFLALMGHGAPSSRLSWRAKVDQLRARLFRPRPAARLVRGKVPACSQDCNQGRACTCQPQTVGYALGQGALAFDSDELDHWKARALAAEKKIRDEQFARLFEVPHGGKYAG
jgi:hypothetical protein